MKQEERKIRFPKEKWWPLLIRTHESNSQGRDPSADFDGEDFQEHNEDFFSILEEER